MTGDKELRFRDLAREQGDRIYRLCCCYLSSEEARQDAYQETLVRLWRSLDSFEGRASLSTWVYRVTVNSCLAYLRGEQRRQRLLASAAAVGELPATVDHPADATERDDEIRQLYACVNELPLADRALISLYLDEADTSQMAAVLGISEGNVRVKLHRIRKQLHAAWERNYHGPR